MDETGTLRLRNSNVENSTETYFHGIAIAEASGFEKQQRIPETREDSDYNDNDREQSEVLPLPTIKIKKRKSESQGTLKANRNRSDDCTPDLRQSLIGGGIDEHLFRGLSRVEAGRLNPGLPSHYKHFI